MHERHPETQSTAAMTGTSPQSPRSRNGFTLVELLVVTAIITALAALTIPAASTVMKGSQLTRGAQLVRAQLDLARQTALSKNRSVEVRLYQFADPEAPGEQAANPATGRYRALQLFEISESGLASPLGKILRLPATIIIDSGHANPDETLSSIISLARPAPSAPATATGAALNVSIPPAGTAYNAVSFRFLPEGSTDLSSATGDTWFLTLHNIHDGDSLAAAPANFFTLQIDASNGHVRTFQP